MFLQKIRFNKWVKKKDGQRVSIIEFAEKSKFGTEYGSYLARELIEYSQLRHSILHGTEQLYIYDNKAYDVCPICEKIWINLPDDEYKCEDEHGDDILNVHENAIKKLKSDTDNRFHLNENVVFG